MNVVLNPFSPGAGTPPPDLVGRKDLLEKARAAVERVRANAGHNRKNDSNLTYESLA